MQNDEKKTENAYRSIGEVAKILNLINQKKGTLNTHTIRYWEKEFKQIKPIILSGRRRYYDKKSIELLKKIKFLLKSKGMTISGVKKILNTNNSFELDVSLNNLITADKKLIFKNKIKNIVKIVKDIKKIK